MNLQTAHKLDDKVRTADIFVDKDVSFDGMDLLDTTLNGLRKCGFQKPSPIQHRAIPLGRCGFDLILQAKSGTGKTVVFGVIALEMVQASSSKLQALILAPTREIAVQIQEVLSSIGCCLKGLKVESFIGGTPLEDDRKKLQGCNIAVGAPGRIGHLIQKKVLNADHIRLYILDEIDKLLESSFSTDINYICSALPQKKQVIVSSATYSHRLDDFVTRHMNHPSKISPRQEPPILLGIKQYVTTVKYESDPETQLQSYYNELNRIFTSVPFNQCLIFTNLKTQAENLSLVLRKNNWPVELITGSQDQKNRLESITKLKDFKCRILVSTDITARGIDAENVNLVINVDIPFIGPTYLHRIGRAGRYGSQGIAITFATGGTEMSKFLHILGEVGGTDMCVNMIPNGKIPDLWKFDEEWPHEVVYGEIGSSLRASHTRELKSYVDKNMSAFTTPNASPLKTSNKINIIADAISKNEKEQKSEKDIYEISGMINDENNRLLSNLNDGVFEDTPKLEIEKRDDSAINKDENTSESLHTIQDECNIVMKNKSLLSIAALMVDTSKENLPVESFVDLYADFEGSKIQDKNTANDSIAFPLDNIGDLMFALENYDGVHEKKNITIDDCSNNTRPDIENDIKYLLEINKNTGKSANENKLVSNRHKQSKKNKLFLDKVREATADLNESYFDNSDEISAQDFAKQLSPVKINENDKKAMAKLQMEEDKKLLNKIKKKINFGDKIKISNTKIDKKLVNDKQLEEDRKFLDMVKAKAKKETCATNVNITKLTVKDNEIRKACKGVKDVELILELQPDKEEVQSITTLICNTSVNQKSLNKQVNNETRENLFVSCNNAVLDLPKFDGDNLKQTVTDEDVKHLSAGLKNIEVGNLKLNSNKENINADVSNSIKEFNSQQLIGKSIDLSLINVDYLINRSKTEIIQYLNEVISKEKDSKPKVNIIDPRYGVVRQNTYTVLKPNVYDLTSDNIDGENLETSNIIGDISNTSDLSAMDSDNLGVQKSPKEKVIIDKTGFTKDSMCINNSRKYSNKLTSLFENKKTDNIKRKNRRASDTKQAETVDHTVETGAAQPTEYYRNQNYNWTNQWMNQFHQINTYVQQNAYFKNNFINYNMKQ